MPKGVGPFALLVCLRSRTAAVEAGFDASLRQPKPRYSFAGFNFKANTKLNTSANETATARLATT